MQTKKLDIVVGAVTLAGVLVFWVHTISNGYSIFGDLLPHQLELREVSVGILPGGQSISNYQSDLGISFDHILLSQRVKNLNYSQIALFLDKGYRVIVNLQFEDNFPNLKAIAEGKYDSQLQVFANDLRKDGREVWIRPLPEFNGDWYNWAALYPGNSKGDFIPAWKHIVTLFRNAHAPVKFELDYNRFNGGNNISPLSDFWVGDDWADLVVITSRDRNYSSEESISSKSFEAEFDPIYKEMITITQKPLGVEIATTNENGEKPEWIREALKTIATRYTKVREVTWFAFNVPNSSGGIAWDWDLNTPEEKSAFVSGVESLRKNKP